MEGLEAVRKFIQSGDFMIKLDVQDAYLSVPIRDSHKKYLQFVFQGITYEFQCLPFGLSVPPGLSRNCYNTVIIPVIILLWRQGIRIVIYQDDMLILDQSPERLSSIFQSVVALLQRLGFLIKQEKCSQAPSQCLEFLGSLINYKEMTQAIPNEKLQNLQLECKNVLNNRWLTLKELSALLGRMNHCSQVGLMDKSTAVAYVNMRGGTRSSTLAALAVEIWNVCQQKGTWITAQHLPGVHSVDVDWASRHFNKCMEWTLDRVIFIRIVTQYYTPQVDLFASLLNHQLPRYVSPTPRLRCNGDQCDDVTVEQMDIIHSCIDCDAASNSEEDMRGSGNLSTNSSKLARPVLVSVTTGDVGGHPCHSSNVREEFIFPIQP
ncbi:Gag-Pro-Pol polyprotein [Stylophora pistillata]|uniref:Gag-Pro-Pol polyprotein n=1 Tax=Stylophora pistillata TaxID=50429 RepID=A0A2B4S9G6_STYPI|nr:Gag-Pro-Pol polyprotein [Stylophora pistillata]